MDNITGAKINKPGLKKVIESLGITGATIEIKSPGREYEITLPEKIAPELIKGLVRRLGYRYEVTVSNPNYYIWYIKVKRADKPALLR